MNKQIYFDFKTNTVSDINSFFVNRTNEKAFSLITNDNFSENIILVGPRKSGKSHLANIWRNNKKALIFNNNIDEIKSIILDQDDIAMGITIDENGEQKEQLMMKPDEGDYN